MNKKKALYTTLAALTLASFSTTTFAEEAADVAEASVTSETPNDGAEETTTVTEIEVTETSETAETATEEAEETSAEADAEVAETPESSDAGTADVDGVAATAGEAESTEEPAQSQSNVYLALGDENSQYNIEKFIELFGAQGVPEDNTISVTQALYDKHIGDGVSTRMHTSALVEFLPAGSGIQVEILTPDVIELTADAYRQAAEASGITDVSIKIAGLYGGLFGPATGQSALTGVYEIFSQVTGKTVDAKAGQDVLKDALENPDNYSKDTSSKSAPAPKEDDKQSTGTEESKSTVSDEDKSTTSGDSQSTDSDDDQTVDSTVEKEETQHALAGTWKNAKGDVITVNADGTLILPYKGGYGDKITTVDELKYDVETGVLTYVAGPIAAPNPSWTQDEVDAYTKQINDQINFIRVSADDTEKSSSETTKVTSGAENQGDKVKVPVSANKDSVDNSGSKEKVTADAPVAATATAKGSEKSKSSKGFLPSTGETGGFALAGLGLASLLGATSLVLRRRKEN